MINAEEFTWRLKSEQVRADPLRFPVVNGLSLSRDVTVPGAFFLSLITLALVAFSDESFGCFGRALFLAWLSVNPFSTLPRSSWSGEEPLDFRALHSQERDTPQHAKQYAVSPVDFDTFFKFHTLINFAPASKTDSPILLLSNLLTATIILCRAIVVVLLSPCLFGSPCSGVAELARLIIIATDHNLIWIFWHFKLVIRHPRRCHLSHRGSSTVRSSARPMDLVSELLPGITK